MRFHFSGDLDADSFMAFAEHRARRLDVALTVLRIDGKAATFDVSGAPDLLDMFEMACSLGPLDCIVRDVAREDVAQPARRLAP